MNKNMKISNNNWDGIIYESLYREYHFLSDDVLIAKWKEYQLSYVKDDENRNCSKIAISVCEDLLRQRGNTYLDDTYPRD